MMQGTYTAATGIASQQKRIDTIANNLANSNTTGFKASRLDFKDALYQNMQRVEQPQDGLNMRKGHGTLVAGTNRIFTEGQYLETGRDLDCYIDGEGFFTVQSPAGEIYYTRDGSFAKSSQADGEYLITADGYYVLDQNGQKIRIQGTSLEISPEGGLSEGGGAAEYARLGIVGFPNQEGLTAVSGNRYAASPASGQPAATDANVIQKVLEGSNVNLADEFSKLIRASRAMQLASRALSTADEMDGTAISTRR
ncbi:flagellar hook-basal body protein [Christensenella intestinihominis]|uniref:flagellar hook-basal body protein n=1 Tax=Christensenella intestinihominis TaxID=1851429 RepID=UPI000835E7E1|nr:flagellar hook-basal body protein [Christensenella intestinihominis]